MRGDGAPASTPAAPLALADELVKLWGGLFLLRRRMADGWFEYLIAPLDAPRLLRREDSCTSGGRLDRAGLAEWLRSVRAVDGDASPDRRSTLSWGAGDLVFGIAGETAGLIDAATTREHGTEPLAFAQIVRTALHYSEKTARYEAIGVTPEARQEAAEVLEAAASSVTSDPPAVAGAMTTSLTIASEEYAHRLARVKAALARGDLYQAVVAVTVSADALQPFGDQVARVADAFRNADFGYCVRWDEQRGYFGFCSLPHVVMRGAEIETCVLAGTRCASEARDDSPEAARHAAEHVMLVDVERSELARICRVGSVVTSPRETVLAGASEYLATRLGGRLRAGVDWADVVVNSFPRAVVVGAPKVAALRCLSALEDTPRGFYGGVTGVVSRDRESMTSIVNVAYAERSGDRVLARCGGGITEMSTAEAELAELDIKLEPYR